MNTHDRTKCYQQGFTLVELLIAMIIGLVITIALYSSYVYQQNTQSVQNQVVAMQQNLRAGSYFLLSEMRVAGLDPQGKDVAGIVDATATSFRFTRDTNDNGVDVTPGDGAIATGTDEDVTLALDAANETLTRDIGGGPQVIAERIIGLEFLYTLKDGAQTLTPSSGQLDDIRAITVSLLARTESEDRLVDFGGSYTSASGATVWGPFDDGFRRRLLTTNVQLRNMGL